MSSADADVKQLELANNKIANKKPNFFIMFS
jgi:hypothetical protein